MNSVISFKPYNVTQPSSDHIAFIWRVIGKTVELFPIGSPKQGSELANRIFQMMSWKSQKIISGAIDWLCENYNYSKIKQYPDLSTWKQALEEAKEEVMAEIESGDWLQEVKIEGRLVTKLEIKTVEAINQYAATEAGQRAKEDGYLGVIYKNYIIPPYGLAAYLAHNFKMKIIRKEKLTIPLGRPVLNELIGSNWDKWLISNEFLQSDRVIPARKEDVIAIRNYWINQRKIEGEQVNNNGHVLSSISGKLIEILEKRN